MIESVQKEIILETFDWGDDSSGRDMMAAMQGAAVHGVHIYFWVDGLSGAIYLWNNDSFRVLAPCRMWKLASTIL